MKISRSTFFGIWNLISRSPSGSENEVLLQSNYSDRSNRLNMVTSERERNKERAGQSFELIIPQLSSFGGEKEKALKLYSHYQEKKPKIGSISFRYSFLVIDARSMWVEYIM